MNETETIKLISEQIELLVNNSNTSTNSNATLYSVILFALVWFSKHLMDALEKAKDKKKDPHPMESKQDTRNSVTHIEQRQIDIMEDITYIKEDIKDSKSDIKDVRDDVKDIRETLKCIEKRIK